MEAALTAAEVLVVDADPSVQKGMIELCAPAGLPVTATPSHKRALELVAAKFFGVVIIDLDTPTPNAGISLVRQVRARSPATLVLVLTTRKTFDGAVLAFRAGADDVIMKAPDQVDHLRKRILGGGSEAAPRGLTAGLLSDVRDALQELLRVLTEAERRALDLEDRVAGREASRPDLDEEIRVLIVEADDRLFRAAAAAAVSGFQFTHAQSGGEALDRVTTTSFHVALVADSLPDLPGSMVTRALKTQAPDTIVLPLGDSFTAVAQLGERLSELADAHRATRRERRRLQAIRERHYELFRGLAELGRRIDKAIEELSH